MEKRKRNVRYKETKSKTGKLHVDINAKLTKRIVEHCKRNNLNKTKYVEQCIEKMIEVEERNYYENLTKDELVEYIIKKSKEEK